MPKINVSHVTCDKTKKSKLLVSTLRSEVVLSASVEQREAIVKWIEHISDSLIALEGMVDANSKLSMSDYIKSFHIADDLCEMSKSFKYQDVSHDLSIHAKKILKNL
jgi:hypothetical protein